MLLAWASCLPAGTHASKQTAEYPHQLDYIGRCCSLGRREPAGKHVPKQIANKTTRGGTRTRNLLLRREAPYPLGHTSRHWAPSSSLFELLSWGCDRSWEQAHLHIYHTHGRRWYIAGWNCTGANVWGGQRHTCQLRSYVTTSRPAQLHCGLDRRKGGRPSGSCFGCDLLGSNRNPSAHGRRSWGMGACNANDQGMPVWVKGPSAHL